MKPLDADFAVRHGSAAGPASPSFKATAMPDRDWWQAVWTDPAHVLREIGIRDVMMVVDLRCGDEYFTAPFSELVDGRVYGVDIDPTMLQRARAELNRTGAPACDLIEADAQDLPAVVPERVAFMLIANTFHGVPDTTALALKIADALKAGGVFTVINWHSTPRESTFVLGEPRGPSTALRMSPEDTRRAVESGGLGLDRVI